jgi:hypothetical protein
MSFSYDRVEEVRCSHPEGMFLVQVLLDLCNVAVATIHLRCVPLLPALVCALVQAFQVNFAMCGKLPPKGGC